MSVEELLKEKSNRLETVPNSYADNITSFQRQVYNEIIKLFDELDIKNGKLVLSKQNLLTSAKIVEKLRQIMSGKEYAEIVKAFIGEFDNQAKLSEKYFTETFGKLDDKELLNLLLEKNKADTLQLLSGSSVDTNFILPVKQAIDTAITSNSSLSETIKSIQTIALGNDEVNGKLLSYSKQIANDSFAFNDRGYTKQTSESYGIVWYRYSGGEVKDTREFCDARVGKYFHKKEIEAWAKLDWQGKYRTTNASNIFTVLGGYNCKHDLLPVSVKSVPKDVIQRNIKNGNFKPTDNEKKLLGIY